MHYYPLLRYARETKLRLPQARVATLDRIPDAAEACRRDELFDSANRIAGMRLLHDDSAADHDTVTVAYTDGSRLLVLARAIESDPAGMRALLAEGQRATRFDGTDMDYNIDKDDSVEFRFDGSCRHEEAFCFAVTPLNARRHRRVSCPMNNHALPENHDLDCSPVYQTAARVGTAWWVAALMVDLAEIGAKGRPVIGFDVVRRRQRDVRQESCWSERLSSGSVDPRSFGHLLLSQSAIAPIALDWGPGRYEDNTVTVTLPPGRGWTNGLLPALHGRPVAGAYVVAVEAVGLDELAEHLLHQRVLAGVPEICSREQVDQPVTAGIAFGTAIGDCLRVGYRVRCHSAMLSCRKRVIRSRFAVRLENCFSQTSLKRANTLRLIDSGT